MGQYHKVVNLDKREFVMPHKLGCGLKLWEQLASGDIGGTGGALLVLLACSNGRGGGDLDTDDNWHGPERVDFSTAGPMPEAYPVIANRIIGRWTGDRIAVVGDYAEDGDLAPEHRASQIYGRCSDHDDECPSDCTEAEHYNDISEDVLAVLTHELHLVVTKDSGWREIIRSS